MPQFLFNNSQIHKDKIVIPSGKPEYHHIIRVFRKKIGDSLKMLNIDSTLRYECWIEQISPNLILSIDERRPYQKKGPIISIYQCINRPKRMKSILRMLTELGVHRIVPVLSNLGFSKSSQTWDRIIRSAIKQSDNAFTPILEEATSIYKISSKDECRLIAWENSNKNLNSIILDPNIESLSLLIGPESGLDTKEIAYLSQYGWLKFRLRGNILRSDTASIVILTAIKTRLELL